MKRVRMGELTVNELQEYLKTQATVILPYGIVEQHGYHLPLDTDSIIARGLAERLAEALGCLVAPSVNYCFSGGMLTGTVNVKPNTFSNLMGEIIESLALQGFRNIVVLAGHGGSESLFHLKESLRILKWLNPALSEVMILMATPWEDSPTYLEGLKHRDYHAGEYETAEIMVFAPELVRETIVMDEPEVAERLRQDPDSYQERTAFTASSQEIVQTRQKECVKVGVMGFPEKATAELGEKIIREFVANAAARISALIAEADRRRADGSRVAVRTPEELRLLQL